MVRPAWCLLIGAVASLAAVDGSWKNKDVSEWTLTDARQLLAASPWVRKAEVKLLPQLTESQLRDAGRMGTNKGLGLSALNPSALTGVGSGKRLVPKPVKRQVVAIRWESAAPVRAAELKTRDSSAPNWDGSFYALAIYGVPGLEEQRTAPVELKRAAFLRRDGNKDLFPQRVELLFEGDLATVLYLFPRSKEITPADKHVWFAAQIGGLFVEQSFNPGEMQFQGKPEL